MAIVGNAHRTIPLASRDPSVDLRLQRSSVDNSAVVRLKSCLAQRRSLTIRQTTDRDFPAALARQHQNLLRKLIHCHGSIGARGVRQRRERRPVGPRKIDRRKIVSNIRRSHADIGDRIANAAFTRARCARRVSFGIDPIDFALQLLAIYNAVVTVRQLATRACAPRRRLVHLAVRPGDDLARVHTIEEGVSVHDIVAQHRSSRRCRISAEQLARAALSRKMRQIEIARRLRLAS